MIISYEEHSSELYKAISSYNANLLNHYNHDVYDKRTVCIDLTSEIELDEQNYPYLESNYHGERLPKTDESHAKNNENSMMNGKKQPTFNLLSRSKNYSCKKTKNIVTNNQNENSNIINDNCAIKMKKTQSNQNDIILLDSSARSTQKQQQQQSYHPHNHNHKKQADILNLNDNRLQLNEFFSNFYHLNTNNDVKKYDLNFRNNTDNKIQPSKRYSSSLHNLNEQNSSCDASSCIVTNDSLTNKSSVEKSKKICLEAIKTSQTNCCNSLQTNQGMHDKDKHLPGKNISANSLCNYDCFSIVNNANNTNKKGHDDLAITNFSNNKIINHHSNHMSFPLSSSFNSLYNAVNNQNTSTTLDQGMPFKKRLIQPVTLSSIDTSFKTQPSDTYFQPSDNSFINNNVLNFSRKILSQSNSSLNRQLKPVSNSNNSCLYDSNNNSNFIKNNCINPTNSYSLGLTLPITIINKPVDKTTNKTTSSPSSPILTGSTSSSSLASLSSSTTTTSGTTSRKEWPTSIVPFKKRNFSSFIEDTSECSISSSLSTTSTKASSNNSVTVCGTLASNEKQLLPKKSKEHLLDPNRQKKIKRCPHVWQFCADLLASDNYNPSIIKWLNKDKGIFKIVKPDKVAELWGAQKNRRSDKKMNYEKMARGMRYSRREGFFKKLDKEKNKPNEYGKQLVFQFSEKVVKNFVNFDWKWSFSK